MSDENIIEINNGDITIDIDDSSRDTSITAEDTVNIDYCYATNKPKINSHELAGNLSASELQLVSPSDLEIFGQKVENIDANSTNNQYPSAKCVFDNLKTKLNNSQITNALLNVPQNIELELNNGTLTLKAGSVVCVPNGFEEDGTTPKFDEVDIESDLSVSNVGVGSFTLMFGTDSGNQSLWYRANSEMYSGSSVPTGQTYMGWYDTTNNLVKYTENSGSTWVSPSCSFPVAQFSVMSGTTIPSIDKTFQSVGYIGSTVFVRKGLKVLIPDGRNADGSLKNIEVTTNEVRTFTESASITTDGSYILIGNNNILAKTINANRYYDNNSNYFIVDGNKQNYAVIGTYKPTLGVISYFQPYIATNILKYSDKSQISGWSMPSSRYTNLTLGASGSTYTAPANGKFWFLSGGMTNVQMRSYDKNGNYLYNYQLNLAGQGSAIYGGSIDVPKGGTCQLDYTRQSGATLYAWKFIYAEGEV